MAEAIKGANQILLFRLLEEQGSESGVKLAFQTEHELTESKDSDAVTTKDGSIQTTGALQTEMSATSILSKGDELVPKLREALRKDKLIEIWEVDITEKDVSDKYPAMYFQGYVTEFSKTPNADDSLEISLSFAINGEGQDGLVSLTAEQEQVVQYVFTDIAPVTNETGE